MKPTQEVYTEMQTAYDHFNEVLFDGELPPCLITLQRQSHVYGYFAAGRFVNQTGATTDEIAMNPSYFAICPAEEVMQTLVHEMVHLWQHHCGKTSRRGYHNQEWAEKMEAVGLVPSSTGKPGGKRTGDKMGDYIQEGGVFEIACQQLLTENFRISWADKFPALDRVKQAILDGNIESFQDDLTTWGIEIGEDGNLILETKPATRSKYSCPACGVNVWGKPELNLICGDCNIAFEIVE